MTSPPYWALRDYGTKGQLGLERDFREYISKLLQVFDELKRVLKRTGSFYLNIGDTYSRGRTIPAKCLIGIPWRVALALVENDQGDIYKLRKGLSKQERKQVLDFFNYLNSQDHSVMMRPKSKLSLPKRDIPADLLKDFRLVEPQRWLLRNDIVWHKCLGSNVPVYAKSQGSLLRTTVRELARLPLNDLWLPGRDGWRKVIRMQRQPVADLLTIHLRNGTRIEVTPDHKFPIQGELVEAKLLKKSDKLDSCKLPSNEGTAVGTYENGWIIGLFLAEGSYETSRGAGFRFSLNVKETNPSSKVQQFATNYSGLFREHNYGNEKVAVVFGEIPAAIIRHYVAGKGAKQKHLSRHAFNESNYFLQGLLDGFLAGDGYYDAQNDRWRFRITANRELEYDLKTLVNRLGFFMRSRYRKSKARGREYPGIEIEIRKRRTGHVNQKDDYEVKRIEQTRGVSYEIEVDGDHLFMLYDGTLTHNSNSMPSSVKDRLSNTYEHIFHFVKSKKYYYNLDEIRVPHKFAAKPFNIRVRDAQKGRLQSKWGILAKASKQEIRAYDEKNYTRYPPHEPRHFQLLSMGIRHGGHTGKTVRHDHPLGKNPGDLWQINSKQHPFAHFAVYPEEVCIRPILSSCPKQVCVKCGAPRLLTSHSCTCKDGFRPGIVLDMFAGSGTTLVVAKKLGRDFVGIELNPEYVKIAKQRLASVSTNVAS
jgi:hypothetical protein